MILCTSRRKHQDHKIGKCMCACMCVCMCVYMCVCVALWPQQPSLMLNSCRPPLLPVTFMIPRLLHWPLLSVFLAVWRGHLNFDKILGLFWCREEFLCSSCDLIEYIRILKKLSLYSLSYLWLWPLTGCPLRGPGTIETTYRAWAVDIFSYTSLI